MKRTMSNAGDWSEALRAIAEDAVRRSRDYDGDEQQFALEDIGIASAITELADRIDDNPESFA